MIKQSGVVEDFIDSTKMLLEESVRNLKIKSSVRLMGYNEIKLSEAKSLLLILEELHNDIKKKSLYNYHEKDDFLKIYELTNQNYLDLITISKIAFKKDIYVQQILKLNLIRKKSFSGWFAQALEFCSILISNPSYIIKLEEFGQRLNDIHQLKTEIIETKKKYEEYKNELEDTQQNLQMRDEILDLLDEWVHDYRKIVRIALKNKPELLPTLRLIKEC
ncbi:hypothetical protein L3073_14105 [Ancylomarina sp. DW003]|nr:hypothetical protein [Ancylomarina sp. DW003]MDE5423349.1 hypothetical protein [Ancylomarina sp. DW003]